MKEDYFEGLYSNRYEVIDQTYTALKAIRDSEVMVNHKIWYLTKQKKIPIRKLHKTKFCIQTKHTFLHTYTTKTLATKSQVSLWIFLNTCLSKQRYCKRLQFRGREVLKFEIVFDKSICYLLLFSHWCAVSPNQK